MRPVQIVTPRIIFHTTPTSENPYYREWTRKKLSTVQIMKNPYGVSVADVLSELKHKEAVYKVAYPEKYRAAFLRFMKGAFNQE